MDTATDSFGDPEYAGAPAGFVRDPELRENDILSQEFFLTAFS